MAATVTRGKYEGCGKAFLVLGTEPRFIQISDLFRISHSEACTCVFKSRRIQPIIFNLHVFTESQSHWQLNKGHESCLEDHSPKMRTEHWPSQDTALGKKKRRFVIHAALADIWIDPNVDRKCAIGPQIQFRLKHPQVISK